MGGNLSCFSNHSAFSEAVKAGDVEEISEALCREPALAKRSIDLLSKTVWHIAAAKGDLKLLQRLVEILNAVSHKTRSQSWDAATMQLHIAALINKQNEIGQTPLMLACEAGHSACVEFLMANGADAWTTDTQGKRTCLHYAAQAGHYLCIEAVLKCDSIQTSSGKLAGRLIDLSNDKGWTALHLAVWHDAPHAVYTLLQHKADVFTRTLQVATNSQDAIAGSTPLHLCAYHGAWQVANMLLAQLMTTSTNKTSFVHDPRLSVDSLCQTPFAVAVKHKQHPVYALLNPLTPLTVLDNNGRLALSSGVQRLSHVCCAVLNNELCRSLTYAESELATGVAIKARPKPTSPAAESIAPSTIDSSPASEAVLADVPSPLVDTPLEPASSAESSRAHSLVVPPSPEPEDVGKMKENLDPFDCCSIKDNGVLANGHSNGHSHGNGVNHHMNGLQRLGSADLESRMCNLFSPREGKLAHTEWINTEIEVAPEPSTLGVTQAQVLKTLTEDPADNLPPRASSAADSDALHLPRKGSKRSTGTGEGDPDKSDRSHRRTLSSPFELFAQAPVMFMSMLGGGAEGAKGQGEAARASSSNASIGNGTAAVAVSAPAIGELETMSGAATDGGRPRSAKTSNGAVVPAALPRQRSAVSRASSAGQIRQDQISQRAYDMCRLHRLCNGVHAGLAATVLAGGLAATDSLASDLSELTEDSAAEAGSRSGGGGGVTAVAAQRPRTVGHRLWQAARVITRTYDCTSAYTSEGGAPVPPSCVEAAELWRQVQELQGDMFDEEWDAICGVCMDGTELLRLGPCGHRLCVSCSKEMCYANRHWPTKCPFCDAFILKFLA